MPNVNINGIILNANEGDTVINVADKAGIYIPRFCYHKNLSIAACCRMCLVDIHKILKPMPACSTIVTHGMKIQTKSLKAITAQKAVMEFLLINHPLDCPICDQAGECELQDISIGYGKYNSGFSGHKRINKNPNFGPLISTEMSRCILCTRCVRFGRELSGIKEIGILGRGTKSQIFASVKDIVSSELSGNIIDICPVGALTAKQNKFQIRPWEVKQYPTISLHDCLGVNLFAHSNKEGKLMRIIPRENNNINETWISDRDRLSYEGIYSNRLKFPMIKKKNQWCQVSWAEAIEISVNQIFDIKNVYSEHEIGAIVSPNSTTEEMFLMQKFVRSFKSNNIDHRINQLDFKHQDKFPLCLGSNFKLKNMSKVTSVLLIGSNPDKDQPILSIKLCKISNSGGDIMSINSSNFSTSFKVTKQVVIDYSGYIKFLLKLLKTYNIKSNDTIKDNNLDLILNNITCDEKDFYIINNFLLAKNKIVILGSTISRHADFAQILNLAKIFATKTNSGFMILTDGANSIGGWLTGCIPHRNTGGCTKILNNGLSVKDMFNKSLKCYVLLNINPENDLILKEKALNCLQQSKCVIAINSFINTSLLKYANILLPSAVSYETSGSFINVNGLCQSFSGVSKSFINIRPGWKILQSLGNISVIKNHIKTNFAYQSSSDILEEFKDILLKKKININNINFDFNYWITSVTPKSICTKYDIALSNFKFVDSLTRNSKALQEKYKYKY